MHSEGDTKNVIMQFFESSQPDDRVMMPWGGSGRDLFIDDIYALRILSLVKDYDMKAYETERQKFRDSSRQAVYRAVTSSASVPADNPVSGTSAAAAVPQRSDITIGIDTIMTDKPTDKHTDTIMGDNSPSLFFSKPKTYFTNLFFSGKKRLHSSEPVLSGDLPPASILGLSQVSEVSSTDRRASSFVIQFAEGTKPGLFSCFYF